MTKAKGRPAIDALTACADTLDITKSERAELCAGFEMGLMFVRHVGEAAIAFSMALEAEWEDATAGFPREDALFLLATWERMKAEASA